LQFDETGLGLLVFFAGIGVKTVGAELGHEHGLVVGLFDLAKKRLWKKKWKAVYPN
jgi:hypothetical protein